MALPSGSLSTILGGAGSAGAFNLLGNALGGGGLAFGPTGTGVAQPAATGMGGGMIDQSSLKTLGMFVTQDPYLMTKTAAVSGVAGGNLEMMKGIEDMMSVARFQAAGAFQDIQSAQLQAALGGGGLIGGAIPNAGAAAAPGLGALNSALSGLNGGGNIATILSSLASVAPTASIGGTPVGGVGAGGTASIGMLLGLLMSMLQGLSTGQPTQ